MNMDVPFTLNSTRNCYALSHAYVPERIPTLMVTISQAIPFFIEDYLGFVKDNWVIFVGYPFEMRFDTAQRDDILACTLALHHPDYLWFIGLEILLLLARCCHARIKVITKPPLKKHWRSVSDCGRRLKARVSKCNTGQFLSQPVLGAHFYALA